MKSVILASGFNFLILLLIISFICFVLKPCKATAICFGILISLGIFILY